MRRQLRHTTLLAGALLLPLISIGPVGTHLASQASLTQTGVVLANSAQSKSNSTAYTLDVELHQHAALATPTLQAQLLNEPSATATLAAMDTNSQAIANSVNQLHPGTHDQFLQLWRSHIDDYKQYLAAAKNNDQAAKQQAKQNLDLFVSNLTNLLAKANSHINKSNLSQQLTTHSSQTLGIIDALVANDFPSAYTLSNTAYSHMTMVAEAMVPSYRP